MENKCIQKFLSCGWMECTNILKVHVIESYYLPHSQPLFSLFSIIELIPKEKGPLCHLIECVQVLQLMSPEHMRGNMHLHQKVPGKSSLQSLLPPARLLQVSYLIDVVIPSIEYYYVLCLTQNFPDLDSILTWVIKERISSLSHILVSLNFCSLSHNHRRIYPQAKQHL